MIKNKDSSLATILIGVFLFALILIANQLFAFQGPSSEPPTGSGALAVNADGSLSTKVNFGVKTAVNPRTDLDVAGNVLIDGNVGIGISSVPAADLAVNNTLKLSSTNSPNNTAEGNLYYNNSSNTVLFHNGSQWGPFGKVAIFRYQIFRPDLTATNYVEVDLTQTDPTEITSNSIFTFLDSDSNAPFDPNKPIFAIVAPERSIYANIVGSNSTPSYTVTDQGNGILRLNHTGNDDIKYDAGYYIRVKVMAIQF